MASNVSLKDAAKTERELKALKKENLEIRASIKVIEKRVQARERRAKKTRRAKATAKSKTRRTR